LGLGVVVIGTLLVFPPALFGVGLVPKLHWKTAHDVIVAVDAERTRNICDLEALLRKAKAGEIIYLTVVRDGRREQIQAMAPDGFENGF
jgi:S1-C subfamily serine protease